MLMKGIDVYSENHTNPINHIIQYFFSKAVDASYYIWSPKTVTSNPQLTGIISAARIYFEHICLTLLVKNKELYVVIW